MQPVSALWVIAVPLMDMATIMVRRIRRGDSPFKPDREHLHHILMRAGLGPRQTLFTIVGFASLLAAIGVIGDRLGVPELLMLGLFLVVFAGYFWSIKF
ncbi:Undecaprenyl-phosphate alpha-N-acetylglucosaminyl 1-phosphate transferase [compost metagenome]